MTLDEIDAALAALGRPKPAAYAMAELAAHRARAKAWDEANPEAAREWHRLAELHQRATADAERAQLEALNTERRLRHFGDRLSRSGVGERSLAAAATPDDTEALGAVKRWLAEKSMTWLALCGAKGTGKSVAATWAVREVIRLGDTAAFRRTSEMAKLSQFEAGAAELEHLKRVHLLVLDDFAAELLTDYARAQMHEVLDHRHEHYGRTILTSNLRWKDATDDAGRSVPGMAARLGERLVDRIAQAGRVLQLSPANSLRRTSREMAQNGERS